MSSMETAAVDEVQGSLSPDDPAGRRIPYGEGAYNSIMDFLVEEARMLDEGRLNDWLKVLADDLHYQMPVRSTVFRREGPGFSAGMNWIYDNLAAIAFKVRRCTETDTAWAEDPPSRTRRFVSNVTLFDTPDADEYLAQSYLLLLRSRGDSPALETISARRDDVVRRTPAGWRLARRTIWVDQSTLGMANLAVFL